MRTKYLCLGIESTAHTFGASVVSSDGRILSNVKHTYTTKSMGIVPSKLAEHHLSHWYDVITKALKQANTSIKDIKLISYSRSPGIGHALRIGAFIARTIAKKYGKALVGVNHCIAHLEIGNLTTQATDPVLLYCSGVNTQVIAYTSHRYRIFGETLDIGIGNLLDSVARDMGLGFPGGPKIEQLAKLSNRYIELPYSVKGMDVSFGGLLTNIRQKLRSGKYKNEDIAFSLQETSFAMLIEVAERAMAHLNKSQLLLGGGVACNKRLQEMAKIMCKQRNARCFIPPDQYLVDNAAMIAHLGILMHNAGHNLEPIEADIDPYERVDDVIVDWKH